MIKIISGHSHIGGSTTALINLTNFFNENGISCTFYGPHNWHLDKCKAALINTLKFEPNDIIICHFIQLPERPKVKKIVLSCHEKNLFEVGLIKQFWDEVIFLNQKHKDYHFMYIGKYNLIPNLKEKFEYKEKPELDKIAGIIGTFDNNKQVDVSIKRALADGCEKVLLFGNPLSSPNFKEKVEPLLSDKVILMGYCDDKQKMYNMIGRVYHSSLSEVATLVKDECELTGTKFFGNDATNYEPISMTNEEILNKWIKILGITK
jgi:hypothetical protein